MDGYMTVHDLNREQLAELKESYFDQLMTEDEMIEDYEDKVCPDYVTCASEVPDDIIFQHYADVCFTDDDFFSTCS